MCVWERGLALLLAVEADLQTGVARPTESTVHRVHCSPRRAGVREPHNAVFVEYEHDSISDAQ